MTRPDRDPISHAHAILRQLDAHITLDEVRALSRCADACGLTVGKWILECAQVQAAKVIDAMQATERRGRNGLREERSERAAQALAARRARERNGL